MNKAKPEMIQMSELVAKDLKAVIITVLSNVKEIHSYYDHMLTMNEKGKNCHGGGGKAKNSRNQKVSERKFTDGLNSKMEMTKKIISGSEDNHVKSSNLRNREGVGAGRRRQS